MREIEEGTSRVSQVKSLLSMVIESGSVWVFLDFSVDKHIILPGPQNLVSVTFPRRPGPVFIINVISFGVVW